MPRAVNRLAIVLLVLVGATITAPSVQAAAPRYIVATASFVPQPVVFDDWRENSAFLFSTGGAPLLQQDANLVGRPYVEFGLFWNSHEWEPIVQAQGMDGLRPNRANGHEQFYPAFGDAEALYVGTLDGKHGARRVTPAGLAILAQRGIPTRLDPPPAP